MVRHIALADQAADCSKSVAVGAAIHRSTTAADGSSFTCLDSIALPHTNNKIFSCLDESNVVKLDASSQVISPLTYGDRSLGYQ